jgi:hypothetical protein
MIELQRFDLPINHLQTLPRIIRRSVAVTRDGVCQRFSYLIDGEPPERSPLNDRLDVRVSGLPRRVAAGSPAYRLEVSIGGGPISCQLRVVFEAEGDPEPPGHEPRPGPS